MIKFVDMQSLSCYKDNEKTRLDMILNKHEIFEELQEGIKVLKQICDFYGIRLEEFTSGKIYSQIEADLLSITPFFMENEEKDCIEIRDSDVIIGQLNIEKCDHYDWVMATIFTIGRIAFVVSKDASFQDIWKEIQKRLIKGD